jgi:LPXTG-motif cell wall-anchored protein
MPEFMMSTPFMIGMGVVLLALIGLLLFLRNQRPD